MKIYRLDQDGRKTVKNTRNNLEEELGESIITKKKLPKGKDNKDINK